MITNGTDDPLIGDAGIVRAVEENSRESTNSPVKELCQKKWKDHAAASGDMANIVTVLTVIPFASGSLVSPPPPRPPTGDMFVCYATLGGSMRFMSTGGETQALFPWCEHLSIQKFPYCHSEVRKYLRDCIPQEVKEHVFHIASSNFVKKPTLNELILSLQVALAEAGMVSVWIIKGIIEEKVKNVEFENFHLSTMEALETSQELHK
ncbi:hypothetical protein PVK06_008132 [Gossypium arboreum]|uniref:Uncharacterized protein n=1 Tax=Gossypium arboreum TaxID=29729 RepID=A0ABR0QJE3_GOSAR|nr:hypothetical protein PVK06_008132 [Gossypium arboreum]